MVTETHMSLEERRKNLYTSRVTGCLSCFSHTTRENKSLESLRHAQSRMGISAKIGWDPTRMIRSLIQPDQNPARVEFSVVAAGVTIQTTVPRSFTCVCGPVQLTACSVSECIWSINSKQGSRPDTVADLSPEDQAKISCTIFPG